MMVGLPDSGKSALANKFAYDTIDDDGSVVDEITAKRYWNNEQISLNIWDTGTPDMRNFVLSNNAELGIIFGTYTFSLSLALSLSVSLTSSCVVFSSSPLGAGPAIDKMPEILRVASKAQNTTERDLPKVIVSTHHDIDSTLTDQRAAQGAALAALWQCPFIKVSNISGIVRCVLWLLCGVVYSPLTIGMGVEDVFKAIIQEMDWKKPMNAKRPPTYKHVTLATKGGSQYIGQIAEFDQPASSKHRKQQSGTSKKTTKRTRKIPHGKGIITYTREDNPLVAIYEGYWHFGQKHEQGELTLRPIRDDPPIKLKASWAFGRLVKVKEIGGISSVPRIERPLSQPPKNGILSLSLVELDHHLITTFHSIGPPTTYCIYDFMAADREELTLHTGDEISDIAPATYGWLTGHHNGKSGVFPVYHVHQRDGSQHESIETVLVLTDVTPSRASELAVKAGTVLEVIVRLRDTVFARPLPTGASWPRAGHILPTRVVTVQCAPISSTTKGQDL